jgi:hypothetical protein
MTGPTSHERAFESLPELSLGALDGVERDAVEEHVRGCQICRRELESLDAVTGALGESVAPVPMEPARSSELRERLIARARSESPASSASVRELPRTRGGMSGGWLAAAALLLVAGIGSAWLLRERSSTLAQLRSAEARVEVAEAAIRERDRQLAERSAMLAALTGPDVAVVNLASREAQDPSARMFWDRATNQWTLVGHNLPQPAAGRTYQLWLITANERISAGTFRPGADGDAVVRATYALDRDALVAIAVTEEPEGGVPQPTGSIVISGQTR